MDFQTWLSAEGGGKIFQENELTGWFLRFLTGSESFLWSSFFAVFYLQKFCVAFFYYSYVSIGKDLQKTIVLSPGPFNARWNESSASRPSHDKVPKKHAAIWQGNTSRRSAIPTELLLSVLYFNWNHSLGWVPSTPADSRHMPRPKHS